METLSSRSQYVCNSIKTFDFSTLYTTITHTLLNLVIGRDKYHFVKNHSKDNNKYKHEIIQMLDFLIDNIFVLFGGRGFQQTISIPMGMICARLFADLLPHAYDADFLQGLSRIKIEN